MLPTAERRRFLTPVGSLNEYLDGVDDEIEIPITEALSMAQASAFQKASDQNIINMINGLKGKAHGKLTDTDDQPSFEHSPSRIKFLALNFVANERGLIAPVFRPQIRDLSGLKRPGEKNVFADLMYSLDRQLIDLHWTYYRSKIATPDSECWIEAPKDEICLWSDELDPSKAIEFIRLTWKSATKANALALSEGEQVLLASIRSPAISDRHYQVSKLTKKSEGELKGYIAKSRQLKLTDLPNLSANLKALRLAQRDVNLATDIRALMDGKLYEGTELDSARRRIRRHKNTFQNWGLLQHGKTH